MGLHHPKLAVNSVYWIFNSLATSSAFVVITSRLIGSVSIPAWFRLSWRYSQTSPSVLKFPRHRPLNDFLLFISLPKSHVSLGNTKLVSSLRIVCLLRLAYCS